MGLLQVPVEVAATPESLAPDIEAIVSSLLHAGDHASRHGMTSGAWTSGLGHLDDALVTFGQLWLRDHNSEIERRIEEAQRPAAAREPSARLKQALAETRTALTTEMHLLANTVEFKRLAKDHKDELAWLMQHALAPEHLVDLLAQEVEEELMKHLAAVRSLPHQFLTKDFAKKFDALCGRAWAARLAQPAAQSPLIQEERDRMWSAIDVKVLAATFTAVAT